MRNELKCTIDGQPRLTKTQLTNWFPDNEEWKTLQQEKHVYDCLEEVPLKNEEGLTFFMADSEEVS